MMSFDSLLHFSVFSKLRDSFTPPQRRSKMTVGKLLSPCMFGHGDMLKTRDEDGHLALECADCGHVRRVLQQPAIKGPKHAAAPVAGAPVLKVRQLRERSFPRLA